MPIIWQIACPYVALVTPLIQSILALTEFHCVRTKRKICSTSGDTGGWTVAMYQSLILMVRSVNRIRLFGSFFNRVLLLYERTFCRLSMPMKKMHCSGKEMKALNVIILEMLRNKGTYQICIKVKEKTKRKNVRVQNRNVLFVFFTW